MRPPSRGRPWGKMDVHWTTEVVRGASCDIHGPTTTVPWPFAQRSLQGQLRLVTFHGSSMGRPGGFMLQPIRARPYSDPTVTHHGQKVGRPWAVRNRKLTFPYTSWCRGLSQSEHGPSMTDRDTLQTGAWLSPGRPKPEIDHGDLLFQPIRVRPVTVRNRKLIFLKTLQCWGLAEFCIVFS